MLARLTQRHRKQILLHERLAFGDRRGDLGFDFGQRNLLGAA